MVIRVVADRVASAMDFREPVDVLLLEHATDGKEMEYTAVLLDPSRRLDSVALGVGVEVPFLIVPMGLIPRGIMPAHLQVEGDGHERFAVGIRPTGCESTCCLRMGGGECRPCAEPCTQ